MIRAFACLLTSGAFVCQTFAEHRSALLIGNSRYPDAALVSPANDVKAIAAVLQERGFTVMVRENLNREQSETAIKEFSGTVATNGTALVYFSGYALTGSGNKNILLPIDGNASKEHSVASSRFGVQSILKQLVEESGSSTNIVIVDGSYRHPKQAEESPNGVGRQEFTVPDSIAIYSTKFGEALEPVESGSSPFATKLANELRSNKSLAQVLQAVAEEQQSTLENLQVLSQPASRAVSPPSQLPAGKEPGDEWVNEFGIVFNWCPPGKFTMGSRQNARIADEDESEVEVNFNHGFWLGKYEFTRREIKTMTGRHTYMATGDHKLQPLDKARKDDPPKWLEILNKSAPKGWVYDLPTEAEWEYAARAGTTTTFYFGENVADLPKHANFADVSLRNHEEGYYTHAHRTWNDGHMHTARVGSYPANPWGFHDMYGNIAEMTSTHYHPERNPPKEFDAVDGYVTRGGCWLSIPEYCRSAFRNQFSFHGSESIKPNHTGFRFVLRRKP